MDTNRIDGAISSLERAADIARDAGRWDTARDFEWAAREARQQLRLLQRELPRLREFKDRAERAYDAGVKSPSR